MSRIKRTTVAGVLCLGLLGSSCLGPFKAFNKVSDWNQTATDNKFVNELIFLGLNIVPVYGVAMLGDAIIFNSMEFWGADNPMD